MEIDDLESDYEEEEYLVYIDIDPASLAEEQIRDSENIKTFGLNTGKNCNKDSFYILSKHF